MRSQGSRVGASKFIEAEVASRLSLLHAFATIRTLFLFLPLTACGLAGCRSMTAIDVIPSSIFDGAAFWIYPAEVEKRPYVFRSHGDQAYISADGVPAMRVLSIPSCHGLQEDLAHLNATAVHSVQIITTPRSGDPDRIDIGNVRYALKFHANYTVNELRLESYDPHAVPWVAAAISVRDRVASCVAGS